MVGPHAQNDFCSKEGRGGGQKSIKKTVRNPQPHLLSRLLFNPKMWENVLVTSKKGRLLFLKEISISKVSFFQTLGVKYREGQTY